MPLCCPGIVFPVLKVDDGAVDHANNCDPVFTHIGLKADNTVISKETEKGKASEEKKFIRTGKVMYQKS